MLIALKNDATDNDDKGFKACETAYNNIKKQVEKQGYQIESF